MKHVNLDHDTPAIRRKRQRQERDARRGELGPGRYSALVKDLAGTIRLAFEAGATASLFGLEGPLRHGIRADLCLQGWPWTKADLMAREMLEDAFRVARAVRPSWEEGQQEWAIHAGTLIERTRCVRCHGPLPEGHYKFCSNNCAASHSRALGRLREAQEDRAVKFATISI
ncbi:hypothetical protein PAF17_18980 [Paracoccus sp. Z330]|uniref:Uncharacterized protein n=1 Tax=Paracoccus onchidii TaxID=3017813 RepID=A0ABT4ZJL2_9RHOB|nr:hypothetical protein [Paracoccus onchidii]MDB6179559.1 hypothetical protein [Paracoccus onchidii]